MPLHAPLHAPLTVAPSPFRIIYNHIGNSNRKFAHLIDTNESPSSDEVVEIKKAITIAKHYLSFIRDDLTKLVAVILNEAKRSRTTCNLILALVRIVEDDILFFIRQHQRLLSVVRRVPPEIWALVFTHFSTTIDPCHIDLSAMPWVLGRVCSDWRAIVAETPAIWTDIYLDLQLYNLSDPGTQARRERMENIIYRSGAIPRQLDVQSHESVADATLNYTAELLLRDDRTISSLTLQMPLNQFQIFREHLTPSRLSSLEELVIDIPLYDLEQSVHDFAIAPRLKRVEIVTGIEFLCRIALPLEQLEDVVVHESTGDDVLLTVSSCPNMRTMDFAEIIEPPIELLTMSPLKHENLRSVILGDVMMLDHLDLPSIVSLGVGCQKELDVDPAVYMQTLYNFVRRCGQKLEVLDLGNIPMKEPGVLPVLEQVPTLRRLFITIEEPTNQEDTIIRSVILSLDNTDTEKRSPFLPLLEECKLHFHREKVQLTIIDHCLVRMLRSRFGYTKHSTPLKVFRLYAEETDLFSNINDDDIQVLKNMVDNEHLDIEIGYSNRSEWLV